MDVYLSVLAGADAAVASRLSEQWSVMQTQGATEGAISTFTTNPTACRAEQGASTNVQAMSSFDARCADEGEADRAWKSGILGCSTERPSLLWPGLAREQSSGLGLG